MSRIVIVMLLHYSENPIDSINLLHPSARIPNFKQIFVCSQEKIVFMHSLKYKCIESHLKLDL
jgi:hypothetical protein